MDGVEAEVAKHVQQLLINLLHSLGVRRLGS
jgi:hypothetical protein